MVNANIFELLAKFNTVKLGQHKPFDNLRVLTLCWPYSLRGFKRESVMSEDVAEVAAAAVAAVTEEMGMNPPGRRGDMSQTVAPFTRPKSDNPVWQHFKRSTKEEKAKCDTCGAMLSWKGGTTGPMRNHLKTKHKLVVEHKVEPGTSELVGDKVLEHNFRTLLARLDHIQPGQLYFRCQVT